MVKWNTKQKRISHQRLGLLDLGPVLLRTLRLLSNFFLYCYLPFWNDGIWYGIWVFG